MNVALFIWFTIQKYLIFRALLLLPALLRPFFSKRIVALLSCFLLRIISQLVTQVIGRTMSRWNTKAPGETFVVVLIAKLIA